MRAGCTRAVPGLWFANNSRVEKGGPADRATSALGRETEAAVEACTEGGTSLALARVMRYRVTTATEVVLREVVQLVRDTRHVLGGASGATIETWDEMRLRFPTDDDARQGFLSLCEMDLLRLRADLRRFREESWGPSPMGRVQTEVRQAPM